MASRPSLIANFVTISDIIGTNLKPSSKFSISLIGTDIALNLIGGYKEGGLKRGGKQPASPFSHFVNNLDRHPILTSVRNRVKIAM
jgi:hypothetical protein